MSIRRQPHHMAAYKSLGTPDQIRYFVDFQSEKNKHNPRSKVIVACSKVWTPY